MLNLNDDVDSKTFKHLDHIKRNCDERLHDIKFKSTDDKVIELESYNGYGSVDADYQAYLYLANSPDSPFVGEILNFKDFVDVNYAHHALNLTFVPKLPSSSLIKGYSKMRTLRDVLVASSQTADDVSSIINEVKSAANSIPGAASKFMDVLTAVPEDGESGGRNNPPSGQRRRGMIPHGLLNFNPKSVEVRLDTGIDHNLYTPFELDAISDASPLHLTHSKINFTSLVTGYETKRYYDSALIYAFQTLAQMAVSFNVNATTIFTVTRMNNYLNAVATALEVYYFLTSVIAFADNTQNNYTPMRELRGMIDADMLNDLNILQFRLTTIPIPPNLNHLIFWKNQTYRESSLPGSALIKFMPFKFNNTGSVENIFSSFDSLIVKNVIDSINIGSNLETINLMGKVCPGWVAQELLAPINIPIHDPGFTTLWCNSALNSSNSAGSVVRAPVADDKNSLVTYASFTNRLDGAVQALQPIFDLSTNSWIPSLIDMDLVSSYATTRYTNRISYLKTPIGDRGFVPVIGTGGAVVQRNEVHQVITTTVSSFQRAGSEIVYSMTGTQNLSKCQELCKWLLSLDSIGSGVKALKDKTVPPVSHVNSGKSNTKSSSKSSNKPRRGKRGKGKSNPNKSKGDMTNPYDKEEV